MSNIDDYLASQAKPKRQIDPAHSMLAGMAELRDVLDALPNSRAELESIVERARVLVGEIEDRLRAERMMLQAFVAGKADTDAQIEQAVSAAEARLDETAEQASARMAEVESWSVKAKSSIDSWVRSAEERIAGLADANGATVEDARSAVRDAEKSLSADLDRKIQEGTAMIRAQADLAREQVGKDLARLREDTDTRFKRIPTMVSAPPTPTKIMQDGLLVGERRVVNFTGATVTDDGSKVTVAISAAPLRLTLNAQTGTSYTLVLGDEAELVTLSNASAIALTVPTNASVAYAVGTQINLAQIGAGQVTVAGAGGVTVNATPGLKFRAQYSAATLMKTASDTWLLVGDLSS